MNKFWAFVFNFAKIALIVFVVSSLLNACSEQSEKASKEAYDKAYDEGYFDGYNEAYNKYESEYEYGYDNGYDSGYDNGSVDTYFEAYAEGHMDAKNGIDPTIVYVDAFAQDNVYHRERCDTAREFDLFREIKGKLLLDGYTPCPVCNP